MPTYYGPEYKPDEIELLKRIGARVKARRNELQVTTRELASFIGLCPSTINRIEGGYRLIRLTKLMQLADALGMTLDDLVRP